jgi:transposase-like protein
MRQLYVEKVARARALIDTGLSYKEVAQTVGVDVSTLGVWKRKGLVSPSRWRPEPSPHGTYARHCSGCRCGDCRAANAREIARQRSRRRLKDFKGRHGYAAYVNWKCRCDECVTAASEYRANRRTNTLT